MGYIWNKIRSWDPIDEWKSTDSNRRKVWIVVRVTLMIVIGIAIGLIVLAFKLLFIIAGVAFVAGGSGSNIEDESKEINRQNKEKTKGGKLFFLLNYFY